MSGAPVLDLDTDRVVGMISEIWIPPRGTRHRDTAFAIRAESLKVCYPQLVLRQPVRRQSTALLTKVADVSELLRLLDYRILDKVETETFLLFKCEKAEAGRIIPVLINVVEGKVTGADEERLRLLLLSAKIDQGIILSIPLGEEL